MASQSRGGFRILINVNTRGLTDVRKLPFNKLLCEAGMVPRLLSGRLLDRIGSLPLPAIMNPYFT